VAIFKGSSSVKGRRKKNWWLCHSHQRRRSQHCLCATGRCKSVHGKWSRNGAPPRGSQEEQQTFAALHTVVCIHKMASRRIAKQKLSGSALTAPLLTNVSARHPNPPNQPHI
jgi:hypothetical protein